MEGSFSRSCEWAAEIPRLPTVSYAPLHENLPSRDRGYVCSVRDNRFCMETASAFAAVTTSSTAVHTTTPADLSRCAGYECSAGDLGLLNIPSIHDTLGSSLDLPDTELSRRQYVSAAGEWEDDSEEEDGGGDAFTLRGDALPSACDMLEEDMGRAQEEEEEEEEEASGDTAPRQPLKRLRRQRANDRERRRMKSLNGALNNLKRCIPMPKTKRRVTKLEILRIACHYIQTLWETLNNENEGEMERAMPRNGKRINRAVNGMTVTQRLNLLSNNLKFNFQL